MSDGPCVLEHRYLVLKFSDTIAALDLRESLQLGRILAKVEKARKARGADALKCVVVEHDWPEYQPTVDTILARAQKEQL